LNKSGFSKNIGPFASRASFGTVKVGPPRRISSVAIRNRSGTFQLTVPRSYRLFSTLNAPLRSGGFWGDWIRTREALTHPHLPLQNALLIHRGRSSELRRESMIALFNHFCALSSADYPHRNQKLQFSPLRHCLPHQDPSLLRFTTFAPSMNYPVVPKVDLCWKRRQHRFSAMTVSFF
jgi:hypothetical protein